MNKRVFSLIQVLFCLSSATGQTIPFMHYTIHEGLPQSTVYTLLQSREGYLWAGTQGGACAFDGRRFQVWDSQIGMPDNHVTSLSQAFDNSIWFGHRSGALSYLKDNRIITIGRESLPNASTITSMQWVGKVLLLATEGNGLFTGWQSEGKYQFTHFRTATGLPSDTVKQIVVRNVRQVWLATSGGLVLWDVPEQKPVLLHGLVQEKITAVLQLPDSTLWYAGQSGLLRVDPGNGFAVLNRITAVSGLRDLSVHKLALDHRGNLWMVTTNGVGLLEKEALRWIGPENGLLSQLCYDVLEDREGQLWISQDDGLSSYKESPFSLFSTRDGLVHSEVYSIAEASPNCYWVATSGGVSLFSPQSSLRKRSKNFTVREGLPGNLVYKIFKDSRGTVWAGTMGHGAARYHPKHGRFEAIGPAAGLLGKKVAGIQEDAKGRIWFTTLDAGVGVFDYHTGRVRTLPPGRGFPSQSVWTAYRDRRGVLWFGTRDQGLVRLREDDTFQVVAGQDKLASRDFGSIGSDQAGNLWIASIGGGIFKYDGRHFYQFGTRQGLKSNNPYFIYPDGRGQVWLGTNVGLDLFDVRTIKTTSFTKQEGFIGIETNQNAVHADQKGNLWIGTVHGLMRLQLPLSKPVLIPPNIYLTQKRLFFEEVDLQK